MSRDNRQTHGSRYFGIGISHSSSPRAKELKPHVRILQGGLPFAKFSGASIDRKSAGVALLMILPAALSHTQGLGLLFYWDFYSISCT